MVLAFVLFIHLCEVLQSCNSISSIFLTHAALDSEFCRNIIEDAKRHNSHPGTKKKPVTPDIIRNILGVHNGKDATLNWACAVLIH